MMGEFIMRLFHARTDAHVLHLKTRSYAAHVALQGFYEGIVDLADTLAETYQGDYGLIEEFASKFVQHSDGLSLLSDLSTWIEKNRYQCCDEDDTYMQNIIDEVVALIRQTEYKLRFLK